MDNELFIMEVEKQTILSDITHHFYKDKVNINVLKLMNVWNELI